MRRLLTHTVAFAVALLAVPATAAGQIAGLPTLPIPGPSLTQPAPFEGEVATPNPVSASAPPQHPFMAPNERSNIHNDAYMSDAYRGSGPLGRDMSVSSALFVRECASITFDSQGRIVTVCVGIDRPVLALIEPSSLTVLASMPLPLRNLGSLANLFSDFSGGGYFYLDHRDHAILPTTEGHILDVATVEGPFGPRFDVVRDYDLSATVPIGEGIVSVLPDWSGRLWFVTRHGIVGTLDPDSGAVQSLRLDGEGISNSFSVDETGGVFVVSDRALYRFDAGPGGEPAVSWREVYPNSGVHKPGQSDAGSGTTPTLIGARWVSITDNADPMDVVVYRRERAAAGERRICAQPVFDQGGGNTDQSLIGTDDSMIVENNYGYSGPLATQFGGTTVPGLARVDITETETSTAAPPASAPAKKAKKKKHKKHKGKRHKKKKHKKKKHKKKKRPTVSTPGDPVLNTSTEFGCKLVWRSEERSPSVVPKLSLANGLVYTYTKPKRDDGTDAWYFTALDFRSGATVFKRLAGIGLGFNNHYAPVTLGPDGAAYVGTLGGVVRLQDQP